MNTKEFLKSLLNEYAPKDKDIEKIIAIISDEEKIGGDRSHEASLTHAGCHDAGRRPSARRQTRACRRQRRRCRGRQPQRAGPARPQRQHLPGGGAADA